MGDLRRAVAVAAALLVAGCGGKDSEPAMVASPATSAAVAGEPYLAAVATAVSQQTDAAEGGIVVADSGFLAETDGFAFENYGRNEGPEVRAQEMRELFGDGVCVDPAQDPCVLTPAAEQWRVMAAQANEGGHCVGFSLLALQMRLAVVDPRQYGAETPHDLRLIGPDGGIENDELAADLSKWAALRLVPTFRPVTQDYTPRGAVAKLREAFASDDDNYLLGFGNEGKGGHAVVATKLIDRGGGSFEIAMYDNNFPYSESDPARSDRRMRIDVNRNTWEYTIAPLPDQPQDTWRGGPDNPVDQSLGLWPGAAATLPQQCPVCEGAAGPMTVALSGDAARHGHLRIADERGRVTGWDGERFVNRIPGARRVRQFINRTWLADPEPIYHLPSSGRYAISVVDAPAGAPDATIHATGPGLGVSLVGVPPAATGTILRVAGDGTVALTPRNLTGAELRVAAPGDHLLRIRPGTGRLAVRPTRDDVRLVGRADDVAAVDVASKRTRALPTTGALDLGG